MNATVIDTLRFANRLKAAGFEAPRAEGMARALGDELADRMLTRSDLDEALGPVQANIRIMEATVEAMDTKFDAKFEAMDTKFDAKFEALDAKFETKFEALDAKFETKFDALEPRFDAMDAKFDALDVKIESVHREFSGKFNILLGGMALGFTLLVGLGTYNAVSPHLTSPVAAAPSKQQASTELPGNPPLQPGN